MSMPSWRLRGRSLLRYSQPDSVHCCASQSLSLLLLHSLLLAFSSQSLCLRFLSFVHVQVFHSGKVKIIGEVMNSRAQKFFPDGKNSSVLLAEENMSYFPSEYTSFSNKYQSNKYVARLASSPGEVDGDAAYDEHEYEPARAAGNSSHW